MANLRPALPLIKGRHGAAIIMALMVVIIAASLAYALLDGQDLAIRQTEGITARAQAMEQARAAMDRMAQELLRAGIRDIGAAGDDGSLSATLDLTAGAGVRLTVHDEQGKLNLNNLVVKDKPSAVDIKIFINLLQSLNLSPSLADTLTDWMDPDQQRRLPGGAEDDYYLGLIPPRLTGGRPLAAPEEAAMAKGFGADEVKLLLPHITALPSHVRLNVNSATAPALAAAIEGLNADQARNIVNARKDAPFATMAEFRGKLPQQAPGFREESFTLISEYYLIVAEVDRPGAWVRLETLAHLDREKQIIETIWRRSI